MRCGERGCTKKEKALIKMLTQRLVNESRNTHTHMYIYIYSYIHICIYTYIHIHRERYVYIYMHGGLLHDMPRALHDSWQEA